MNKAQFVLIGITHKRECVKRVVFGSRRFYVCESVKLARP